eukprot:1026497-Amorphochlora_amoeboformis.AAC.2
MNSNPASIASWNIVQIDGLLNAKRLARRSRVVCTMGMEEPNRWPVNRADFLGSGLNEKLVGEF